ncbi:MFS transporter [Glutamicibacter uratoxydans]|uniref:MFS transporter n=1 Tax=Glutamicibacter uratoxydans TaxID=43667 RepID=UPI003D6E980E
MTSQQQAPASGTGRWLLVLILTAILSQTTLNLVRPVTTYKLLTLNAGSVMVGITTAVYAILPLAVALWLGRISSRVRQIRYLMLWGILLIVLGSALIGGAPTIPLVAAGSAVLGLGHLVFTIGGQSSIARFFPDNQLDKAFGWFTAAFAVGQVIGPLVAGGILGASTQVAVSERAADVNLSLWIGAAASALAIPLLMPNLQPRRIGKPQKVTASAAPEAKQASVGAILRTPGVASHMFAGLALLSMIDILTAFLPLVAEHYGVAPAAVGVLLAVRGAASVISRMFLPWFSRHLNRSRLVLGSLYGTGLSFILVPLLLEHLLLASAILFIGGFLMGLGQPLTMSMVSTAVAFQDRGTALAVRLMGNRVGQVLIPVAASSAAVLVGPGGAIWFCCALLCVSGIEKSLRSRREL